MKLLNLSEVSEVQVKELGSDLQLLSLIAVPQDSVLRIFFDGDIVQDSLDCIYSIRTLYDGTSYFGVVKKTNPKYDAKLDYVLDELNEGLTELSNSITSNEDNRFNFSAHLQLCSIEGMAHQGTAFLRQVVEAFSELEQTRSPYHYLNIRERLANMEHELAPDRVNKMFRELREYFLEEFKDLADCVPTIPESGALDFSTAKTTVLN